jgi:5-methyltetrahydrofolate--homocysteine methyltransferase
MIGDIHRRFLEAGADIIETNTFGATSITPERVLRRGPARERRPQGPSVLSEHHREQVPRDLAWEINFQSAQQCRTWADRIANNSGKRRFVAGAVGPLTVSLSNSPDADDAGFRVVTFDQVKADYRRQVRALIAGGVDLLLVETIFDSLNAKAALVAIEEVFAEDNIRLPLMISAAVGRGGETMISAQTVGAFWNAVRTQAPLGRPQLLNRPRSHVRPFLEELGQKSDAFISCLPERRPAEPAHPTGLRPEARPTWAASWRVCRQRPAQHRGRCCGNTPEHIAAIAESLKPKPTRKVTIVRPEILVAGVADPGPDAKAPGSTTPATPVRPLRLSGSLPFTQQPALHDDRRAHQRRRLAEVREAHQGGKYEEAVAIARQQVENGANVIDICMDEG